MSQRRPVTYVRIERLQIPTERRDRFTLRHDRKAVWLQRACFWLLGKLRAYDSEVITTFVRHPQENDDILKALLTQERWLLEALHEGHEKFRVYVGPDEAPGLFALVNYMGFSHVTLDARIDTRSGMRDLMFHNIPIVVVPWMNGVLIAPVPPAERLVIRLEKSTAETD